MCGESGGCMWRVKEAEETKDETHEALRGATGSGNVTLGNSTVGTTTVGSLVTNISTTGAATVNLGPTGTTATASSVVNVGKGAANVNIGNTGGAITLAAPLTLGPAPPGSTGLTSGSAPYLGSFYNPVVSTTMAAASTTQASITIGTPGVYLLLFCLQIAYTTAPSAFYVTISGANIVNNCAFSSSPINAGNTSSQGSIVVSCTASTYNMISNYVPGSGTNLAVQPNSFFQAVRIG